MRVAPTGRMRMRQTTAVLGFLSCAAAGHPSLARAESLAPCPPYVAHLRAARSDLGRGDRPAALTELRRAEEALAVCLREESGVTALAARRHGEEAGSPIFSSLPV